MAKLEDIEFCLTKTTKQLNSTERQKQLIQHGETSFVTISVPVLVAFSKRGNDSMIKSISEVTGLIPYYYLFTSGEYVSITITITMTLAFLSYIVLYK